MRKIKTKLMIGIGIIFLIGFQKKVKLKKGHELKQLEEIVEKIVDETKMSKPE